MAFGRWFGKKKSDQTEEKTVTVTSGKEKAAVFIDFEHWLTGLYKVYNMKPDIAAFWTGINARYDVIRTFCFGDFSDERQRSYVDELRLMTNHIIDTQGTSDDGRKIFTEPILLDALYQDPDALPAAEVTVLFSGDGHFAPALRYLKEKKRKKIVVFGIDEAVSSRLKLEADEFVPVPGEEKKRYRYYKMIIDNMDYVSSRKDTLYATFKTTVHAVSLHNSVPVEDVADALEDLLKMGVLSQVPVRMPDGEQIRVLHTDWPLAVKKGMWDFSLARPMEYEEEKYIKRD